MALATVVHPALAPSRRILAVSDIHGNRAFFRGLLEKAAFSSRDILVLVGDILEKGPDSLGLLRDILELSQDHTILPVCGNCDGLVLRFFEDDLWDQGFFRVYLPAHPESILRQMAREAGFDRWDDLPRLRECLRRTFPWVWDWLRSLPTILENEHLVFVHGGVPSLDRMEELDAWHCMKNDDYWGQGHSFAHTGKYVVVGHWPVTLYDPRIPSAAPIVDRARHIISIDGGCVLKLDGQLNALIIPGGILSGLQLDRLRRLPTGPGPGPTGAFGGFPEHPLGPQPGRGAGAGTGVISVPPSGDWTGAPHPHQLSL